MFRESIFKLEQKPENATAVISKDSSTISYGELVKTVGEMRKYFPEKLLVFNMCKNEPGALMGYVGAVENNAAVLMLDSELEDDQFYSFLNTYKPFYVWAPHEWEEKHRNLTVMKWVYEANGYCLWKTGYEPCEINPELSLLLATSGSTGNPKLVRISRDNIISNTESICQFLEIDENERAITTLPMHYTYGLSILNTHLLEGACILMTTDSYVQSDFWDFLNREKATSFGGVPYTYEILKKIRMFNQKMPSVRTMTQAGGKLSVNLQREIAEWTGKQGIRFFIMYGQTEATARMSYLPASMCNEKMGSIGIPVPGGEFYLINDMDEKIEEPFVTGELIYRGKNVSLGIAQSRDDLMLGDKLKGVLHTGDLAYRDDDGLYYVTGRKKRFLKIFGVRIGLDECEDILKGFYPEFDIACGGEDDCLRIYVRGKKIPDMAETLSDYLNLYIGGFKTVPVDDIPKNRAGKVMYSELESEVASMQYE